MTPPPLGLLRVLLEMVLAGTTPGMASLGLSSLPARSCLEKRNRNEGLRFL